MGAIYCLYSTEDGVPRYVGQTGGEPGRRYRQHLAAALDKREHGAVNEWIRDILRRRHQVEFWQLQEDIAPKDLDLFEKYWIEQFPNLLNVDSRRSAKLTDVASRILQAIRKKLALD